MIGGRGLGETVKGGLFKSLMKMESYKTDSSGGITRADRAGYKRKIPPGFGGGKGRWITTYSNMWQDFQ